MPKKVVGALRGTKTGPNHIPLDRHPEPSPRTPKKNISDPDHH